MNGAGRGCDLCGLDVGNKPFSLHTPDKTLQFCCDGCKGIYRMLHNVEEATPKQASSHKPQK
jgi:hypothetical protein